MVEYFNADFEILAFFVLLFISVYLRTKYSMETEQNREFLRLVITIAGADFFDVLGAFSIHYDWARPLQYLVNTLYFFSAVLTAYIFSRYCFSFYYESRERKVLAVGRWAQIGMIVFLILLLFNLPTGIFFSFTAGGAYMRGPVFPVILVLPAAYFLLGMIFILRHMAAYTIAQRHLLLTFGGICILMPVAQGLFFPAYLANFFFGTVMIFLVLLTIETPDETELRVAIETLDSVKAELEEQVDEETKTLRDANEHLRNLTAQLTYAMTGAIDAKDRYTSGHSARVAYYSRLLAEKLGMNEKEQKEIYEMGLLHDVGKIGVPNSIINKPGRLTDEEYAVMKQHPVIGYNILSDITLLPGISTGARWHHERQDGRGYPDGLTADQIPFEAQIIAVADAYDAMTSYRSYRGVMPQGAVRDQIESGKGTQFNWRIADAMLELIDGDREYVLHEFRKGERGGDHAD